MVDVTEPMADVVEAKGLKRLSLGILLILILLFFLSHGKIFISSSLDVGEAGLRNQSKNHVYGFKKNYPNFRVSYSTIKNSFWFFSEFQAAEISNSILNDFSMLGGSFNRAKFYGNSITLSTFVRSDFSNAELVGNLVENSHFLNVSFSEAFFHGTRFINCDFGESDFRSADLAEVVFLLSNLRGVKFNDKTKLPFTRESALAQGMVYVP